MDNIAGIDYSMTSPAICVYTPQQDKQWQWTNCQFHFFISPAKLLKLPNNHPLLCAYPYITEWTCNEERFSDLATWSINVLQSSNVKTVYMEDYAMGAKGKVFHIAECAGALKMAMWHAGIDITTVAPTALKKFATGKGNAKKDQMLAAWEMDSGIKGNALKDWLSETEKQNNPSSDIVDAGFLSKMCWQSMR